MQKERPESLAALGARLARMPLFRTLSPEQCLLLAHDAHECAFGKGEWILREGDSAQTLHVVLSGKVKVCHERADGQEIVLHIVRPDNFFGEAAVFQKSSYPASVIALEESRTLCFAAAPFLENIARHPELALAMLAALSLRLRMFARKLESQGQGTARSRLAEYLLHRSRLAGDAQEIHLDFSREVLANMLGLARETLSRTFSAFATEGAIQIQGRTLSLNKALLVEISHSTDA